jgi:hypothetical protein
VRLVFGARSLVTHTVWCVLTASLFFTPVESAVGVAWIGAISHVSGFLGPEMFALAHNSPEKSYWPAMVALGLSSLLAAAIVAIWLRSSWGDDDRKLMQEALAETPRASAANSEERKGLLSGDGSAHSP